MCCSCMNREKRDDDRPISTALTAQGYLYGAKGFTEKRNRRTPGNFPIMAKGPGVCQQEIVLVLIEMRQVVDDLGGEMLLERIKRGIRRNKSDNVIFGTFGRSDKRDNPALIEVKVDPK